MIQLVARLCEEHGLSDWRQNVYNVKQVKNQMRIVEKKKRISGKTEAQKEKCQMAVKEAHRAYIQLSQQFLNKAGATLDRINQGHLSMSASDLGLLESIQLFMGHANRQIEQISRRILQGEVIPHAEKVFSLFEPHTEWISKGKAGVPVELGVRVCVLEDQHQFMLAHWVMENEMDVDVALPIVRKVKKAFSNIMSCSFDKGFHSPENQQTLKEELEVVALKHKGKRTAQIKEIEDSEVFKKAAHKHSAVESAINALEVHGLDICKDHGIDGFKRYIGLAIVTRNIHRIGDILYQREQKRLVRKRKQQNKFKLAA